MDAKSSDRSPQNIDKRGIHLIMDSPPAAHPLAVEIKREYLFDDVETAAKWAEKRERKGWK